MNLIRLLLLFPFLTARASGKDGITRRQATASGDRKCGNSMCISATVNGSNVEYILSSNGKNPLGWMGMGFGRQMANTPMVIMWLNADGKVTLSQRSAPREVMPTVDPNPPRIATLSDRLTSVSGETPEFGYTIPANSDTRQFIIYAYGTEVPSSSSADADLVQHLEFGTVQLDLTKGISTSTAPGSSPTSPGDHDSSPSDDIPLLPYQRLIVAHAIFCVLGFLLFLPSGVLLARYLRTFSSTWFTGHWIIQFLIAGPAIIVGVALGVQSVTKAGALHLNDDHKKFGVGLFILYFVQCILGAVIHWIKPKGSTRRPLQNYLHAILGLLIVSLALYQVYSGYRVEWPKVTGRAPVSNGVNVLFFIWVAILPLLYALGLFFLPKQLRQETRPKDHDEDQDEDYGVPAGGYRDRE